MKYEQHVRDIYKIAGMLEVLTCMQDCTINSGMVAELVDAVDKLELIGADLLKEIKEPEPYLMIKGSDMIDFFDDDDPETEVSAHEGTEESPPSPQPPDQ